MMIAILMDPLGLEFFASSCKNQPVQVNRRMKSNQVASIVQLDNSEVVVVVVDEVPPDQIIKWDTKNFSSLGSVCSLPSRINILE